MGKSYTDQLEEWVKRRSGTRRDRNQVAFLAALNDINAAIKAGYAAKTVWANLHESQRIPFSYDTFLIYLRRHHPDITPVKPEPTPSADLPTKSTPATGFQFNPVPKKEELL